MGKISIDLHLHSNKSDGQLTVPGVVIGLSKKKVGFAALTDHDTVNGSKEFIREAKKAGIWTIPGVEMSAYDDGVGVHILGYGIDADDKRLLGFFQSQCAERQKVFEKYVALFKKAGFKIDKKKYGEFRKIESVAKAHVFELIWSVPENRVLCFKKYGLKENKKVAWPFNFQSPFIDSFMSFPGQIAYAKKKRVSAKKTIDLIHRIGGVAVWAHPGLEVEFRKNPKVFPKVFKNLLSYGLDGLEAYSTAASHIKKWVAHLRNLAEKHKLLITLGTDDHDGTRMGSLKVPQKYQKEIIKKLSAKLKLSS